MHKELVNPVEAVVRADTLGIRSPLLVVAAKTMRIVNIVTLIVMLTVCLAPLPETAVVSLT